MMQNLVMYLDASDTLATIRDYANARSVAAPTIVLGVPACLKLRLFNGLNTVEAYPLAAFDAVSAWHFVMDTDFSAQTACKIISSAVSAAAVIEQVDGEERTFTEISVLLSNTNTVELAAALGDNETLTGLNAELVAYDAAAAEVFVLQIKGFTVRNRISSTPPPTPVPSEYFTKDQTLALISGGGMEETVDMVATSAVIPVLEGGRRYVFAQPLSALTLGSVADSPGESEILFNAASGGVAVSLPDDLPVANGGVQFAGSGSYILAFRGGVMAAAELVPPFRVNPFDTDLPEAELFGPAVPMTDFALPVNGGRDKFVRWTSNTIPPSSGNLYFGGSAGSGNLYAGLSGFSYSGGIVYGLSSGTELAGSVNVRAANCSFSNAIWGGEAGAAIDGALNIELDSVAITGVSYASYAPAAGTTRYTIRGGSFGGQACAGIYRNPTNYGNTLTVCGDLYLSIDGTALSGNLIYGDRCKPASGASGMIHQRGDIYLELNSGSAVAEEFCAYSGYLFTGSSDNAISAAGNIRVTINGGTWGDRNNLVNGRGIFGGQFCSDSTATVKSVDITMNGGDVSIIHGGGFAQTTGSSQVLGDVTITLNGGKVGNLLGCGSETSDASTSIGGNINIFLNGGEVSGAVHAAVRHTATQSVSGSSTVTISGTSNYACNFYGYTGLNIADGSRFAALVLKNYTGTLSGAVQGFAAVTLEGNTAVTLSGVVQNNADAWTFDISRRDITLAGTALLSGCTPNAVKLIVGGGTPAADWALLAASALPTGGIEIWNAGGSAALATVTALDAAISGTGTAYDGWGVSVADGKLVFKNLTTEAE